MSEHPVGPIGVQNVDLSDEDQDEIEPLIESNVNESRSSGSENFGDLQEEIRENRASILLKSFAFDVLVYATIWLIYLRYRNDSTCGIPVNAWLIVHISLFMANSFARLIMIGIVRHFNEYRVYYNVVSTLFINCLIVGWLLYGNKLWYSEENNCMELPET